MPPVRIAERRIWLGDESRPLLAGEVHYWRLDPERWPAVLRQARRLGLDVLSTYVCWDFHELSHAEFDFVGASNPRRNLLAFLDLAADEGFWILLRPGPYIYAEWPNSGVPDRVVRYHRLHPEFLAEAKTYMAAVVEAACPRLATHSGRIVLWQADNEPDPWFDIYGSQLGLADTRGLFQDFLKNRYGQVAELNSVWGSKFASFEDVRATLHPLPGPATRYLDTVRFRHWYGTEIVRWTAAEYRRLGVDVPIYANTYSGFDVQHWRDIESVCDLAGPDIYPTADFREDPVEHRRLLDAARYTCTYSSLPCIPEFESGIWHGWHARVGVLPPNQYALTGLSALQGGIAGWSWYMLANRDNWYMSPITELGRARPELSPVFERVVPLFRALDPPSLRRVTDTSVAINVLQRGARIDDRGEPLFEALAGADIDYDFWDVDTGQIAHRVLLFGSSRWLHRAAQQRLVDYVEGGGTLVLFQSLPALDEAMRPLNLLSVREPEGTALAAQPRRVSLRLGEQSVEFSSPTLFRYSEVPGQPLIVERIRALPPTQEGGHLHHDVPVGERITIGYVQQRGAGMLIVLGLVPNPDVLVALHAWLGVPVASHSRTPGVLTALLQRENATFLIATNNGFEAKAAHVVLTGQFSRAENLDTGEMTAITNGALNIQLAAKDGAVVRMS